MAKLSKPKANYRDRDTVGDRVCCNCRHMNGDGTCERVEGIVACDHTCDLWRMT